MKPAIPIFNGLAPSEESGGPKGIPLNLDFTGGVTTLQGDLQQEEASGVIEFVQCAYFDNSASAYALTFIVQGTGQKIVVPSGAQGTWPIFSPMPLRYTATSNGGVLVSAILLNIPVALTQWGPISVQVNTATGSYVNKSGTIAVGGTAQNAAAANPARKRLIIQNPSDAVNGESLFVDFGMAAAAGSSIELLPGGSFDTNFGPVDLQFVSVNAATAGHVFICKEM